MRKPFILFFNKEKFFYNLIYIKIENKYRLSFLNKKEEIKKKELIQNIKVFPFMKQKNQTIYLLSPKSIVRQPKGVNAKKANLVGVRKSDKDFLCFYHEKKSNPVFSFRFIVFTGPASLGKLLDAKSFSLSEYEELPLPPSPKPQIPLSLIEGRGWDCFIILAFLTYELSHPSLSLISCPLFFKKGQKPQGVASLPLLFLQTSNAALLCCEKGNKVTPLWGPGGWWGGGVEGPSRASPHPSRRERASPHPSLKGKGVGGGAEGRLGRSKGVPSNPQDSSLIIFSYCLTRQIQNVVNKSKLLKTSKLSAYPTRHLKAQTRRLEELPFPCFVSRKKRRVSQNSPLHLLIYWDAPLAPKELPHPSLKGKGDGVFLIKKKEDYVRLATSYRPKEVGELKKGAKETLFLGFFKKQDISFSMFLRSKEILKKLLQFDNKNLLTLFRLVKTEKKGRKKNLNWLSKLNRENLYWKVFYNLILFFQFFLKLKKKKFIFFSLLFLQNKSFLLSPKTKTRKLAQQPIPSSAIFVQQANDPYAPPLFSLTGSLDVQATVAFILGKNAKGFSSCNIPTLPPPLHLVQWSYPTLLYPSMGRENPIPLHRRSYSTLPFREKSMRFSLPLRGEGRVGHRRSSLWVAKQPHASLKGKGVVEGIGFFSKRVTSLPKDPRIPRPESFSLDFITIQNRNKYAKIQKEKKSLNREENNLYIKNTNCFFYYFSSSIFFGLINVELYRKKKYNSTFIKSFKKLFFSSIPGLLQSIPIPKEPFTKSPLFCKKGAKAPTRWCYSATLAFFTNELPHPVSVGELNPFFSKRGKSPIPLLRPTELGVLEGRGFCSSNFFDEGVSCWDYFVAEVAFLLYNRGNEATPPICLPVVLWTRSPSAEFLRLLWWEGSTSAAGFTKKGNAISWLPRKRQEIHGPYAIQKAKKSIFQDRTYGLFNKKKLKMFFLLKLFKNKKNYFSSILKLKKIQNLKLNLFLKRHILDIFFKNYTMNYSSFFNKLISIQNLSFNKKKLDSQLTYFIRVCMLHIKQKSYLYINNICWSWAKNRHKQKGNKWIFNNYWLFIKNKLYFYIINNNKINYLISF